MLLITFNMKLNEQIKYLKDIFNEVEFLTEEIFN